jgi:PAS domain S-box-containing protein
MPKTASEREDTPVISEIGFDGKQPKRQRGSRKGAGNGLPEPKAVGAKTKRTLAKKVGGLIRPRVGTRPPSKQERRAGSPTLTLAAALAASASDPSFSEFGEILTRMVDKIVKILQADKCVLLLYDAERSELQAVSPASGIDSDLLPRMTTKASGRGLSAWVFRNGTPVILHADQIQQDKRAHEEGLPTAFGVRNSLSLPLYIEERDSSGNEVLSREPFGVVHVFNKKDNSEFTEQDQSLLELISRNAASIFRSAQAFREVVTEKQELIQTLDSLYVGLMMVGLDGRIIQINPAARSVLGVGADALVVGVKYDTVVKNESFTELLRRALTELDPTELTGEVTAQGKTEERVYQAHCAPVRSHDNSSVVGILALLNDITELRSVDRMKTEFVSTVSHELRTPLTIIKGAIATLLDDKEGFFSDDDKREFYEMINADCDRLTRLIDDLLNVSRIEQGKAMQLNLKPVDLAALVAKVLNAQRAFILPDRHSLESDFSADFPTIEADPDKLDQVLTNLVSNAVKYSPRGGAVRVSGSFNKGDGTVSFAVSDQGLGIPREHMKRVFDRFHRVDNRDNREIGGTGIGLFLVNALTKAHNGTVSVSSEVGKGSTFTVTLPVKQPETKK